MRKAIVTGHSRGLGAAIAERLLDEGFQVLGVSRGNNAALAAAHAAALVEAAVDASDLKALSAWLDADVLRRFVEGATMLVLVNNAGVLGPVGPLRFQSHEAIADAVSLNVGAALMLAARVAALCAGDAIDRRSPRNCELRIVHISSGAARNAYPGWSIYCATKAALDLHAQAVQLDEGKPERRVGGRSARDAPSLRICSLAPGVIDTQMQAEIRAIALERFPLRERFVALKRDGDLTDPAECAAGVVAYVLDDAFGEEAVADLRARGG